ncbi:MAG: HDOD domain-containing protein [Deltaproteobacteria bacterium]|jgi:putative nucleotidyltransferase with HDIG domain|nr:HDOD domain-containing protein [Deltaproteobacteria bacterium]
MKKIDTLDELIATVKKTDNIPTLPRVLSKISEEIDNDNFSIKNIGELMSHDVSLSARILRIVNSPFYGFPQRIYSINHAIVLLGSNVLKSIIISTSVFTAMKETMAGLSEHSLFCAFTAKHITTAFNILKKNEIRAKKINSIDPDMMFSAGLLHDIGKIIIAATFKEDFKKIIEIAEKSNRSLTDIEHDILNISHDQLGYMLIKEWNLPPSIYIPIKYHHNVNLADDFKTEAAILNLADFLTRALGIGYSGSAYLETINKDALRILDVDMDFIKSIIEEIYSYKEELYIFD